MKGNCQRCGHSFELKWKFHNSDHTIDNQICPRCYGCWIVFCEEFKKGIEWNGGLIFAGHPNFFEAFCQSLREKVLFT